MTEDLTQLFSASQNSGYCIKDMLLVHASNSCMSFVVTLTHTQPINLWPVHFILSQFYTLALIVVFADTRICTQRHIEKHKQKWVVSWLSTWHPPMNKSHCTQIGMVNHSGRMQLSIFIAVCGKGETDVSIHTVLPVYNHYSYESI